MTIAQAEMIVALLGIYVAIGAVVALLYTTFGAGKIDPAAKGMPIQARAIIFPGVVGLWPLMLAKLVTQKEPPIS